MVPVVKQDTGNIVYVLPETLKKEPGKYKRVPDSQLDSEDTPAPRRHPGQPRLPKKPKKPHKPEILRDPPPARIHPPIPPKAPLPAKRPRPVKPVKAPKVPEPSPQREFKKVKRYLAAGDSMLTRVLVRYLGLPYQVQGSHEPTEPLS